MIDRKTNQQVLGAIMLHPQYLSEIDKYTLNITDFPDSKLERYIFTAINGLYFSGAQNITPIDVENYLSTNALAADCFKKENGVEYLQDIIELVQPENFPVYYTKLKKINLLNDLKKSGFDTSDFYVDEFFTEESFEINSRFEQLTPTDIITSLKKKLLHLEGKYQAGEEVEIESVGDDLDDFFENLELKEDIGISLQGNIFTQVIGGAKKGTLTIRSAASSVGKSRNAVGDSCFLAFPLRYDWDANKWVQTGHCEKVMYIVTEQSFKEIRKMILAYLTGINESRFKFWQFTKEEETVILQAKWMMKKFQDNLTLVKMPSPTIDLVKTTVRETCITKDIEYVFFDYIFISPSLLNEFKGYALRNDEVLLMFATALKDLAVELNVCMFSSTQLNAKGDDNSNIRNEAALAGGRSTINKADYGCIMARPTKEELELLQNGSNLSLGTPNLVTDMFKVRDGEYTQVRIWSRMDLGTLRKEDLFITDAHLMPIEGFFCNSDFEIRTWEDEMDMELKKLISDLNNGVVQ